MNRPIETTREVYRSPVKRILALIGTIIIIEIVIMVVMDHIVPLPSMSEAIFDSFLLVIMLAPVIYFLIFQPMTRYVSDRKEIIRSLSHEKDFVESLIRTANVIIVVLDKNGKVNMFNETAEKITGYKFGELKGKNWFEVMVPRGRYPKVWDEFVSLTRIGNMPKTFENPILTKSGEERIISWQNGLLREGEKTTGSISFGIDITERIKADKMLANLNRQHQMILNSAAQGILGLDLKGNHTFCNQSAALMLGYSVEELIGHHSHTLWHHSKPDGSVYPEDECLIVKTLINGERHHNESEVFWRKDGTCFPVNWSCTPICEDNKVVGAVVTFTDITDKKQKEQETLKFKLGMEHSNDAIFITDPQGKITYINESFRKIYGYSFEEVLGKTPALLKSDLSSASLYSSFWNTLLSKDAFNHEIVNKAKDGSLITIDSSNNPLLDASGNILGFLSINRDITERKQRELELQILSEIGHSVSTTANLNELMKMIHDSLKKVIYAENCYFALKDEQSGQMSFPYFVDQFDSTPPVTISSKSCTSYVFRTGKSIIITPSAFHQLQEQNEVELIGSPTLSWIGVPLRTESKSIGVLVLQNYKEENVYKESHLRFLNSIASQIANVIERRRSKEAREHSYSLVTATFESTADGILVVDNNGRVTNYNKKFVELWQIPENIIATRDNGKLLSYVLDQLKDPEDFEKKVMYLISNNEEISFDLLEFKDGKIFERYSQPQRFEGTILGRVWCFRNVTEHKQAEAALRASEARLREMNSTKDKFFSIISHDLKSPFYGLIGLSDMLKNEAYSLDRLTVAEFADLINSTIVQSYNLLENLLEWARTQENKIAFIPSTLLLHQLVDDIFELKGDNAKKKNIRLLNLIPENQAIMADRNMLTTVIRNLVANAIKFSYFDQSVEISCLENETYVEITVRDYGQGISKEDQQKLFKLDTNFSTNGTANEKGTGLGLLLCKEFVEKHHGEIWVESDWGCGSRFSFTIPKDCNNN
ncbi:MAG TPA: PAS domain S-box protein [Prolixibacteraceae bacterium]|nr:PAS domain S-box protein [Prolixibacteraceae bacterium]